MLPLIISYVYSNNGLSVLIDKFHLPAKRGSVITAIFFVFSAAMLGISGFESSSNFVEEQKRGGRLFKNPSKHVDRSFPAQSSDRFPSDLHYLCFVRRISEQQKMLNFFNKKKDLRNWKKSKVFELV
jgi:hypothetical protein